MQGHQAGMDPDAHRGQMEVVEQYRQMVVEAPARMKVQLQGAGRGERQHVPVRLLAEPQLQVQRELGPLDRFLQVSAIDCEGEKERRRRATKLVSDGMERQPERERDTHTHD